MSYCNGNESHTRNKQRRIRCLQSSVRHILIVEISSLCDITFLSTQVTGILITRLWRSRLGMTSPRRNILRNHLSSMAVFVGELLREYIVYSKFHYLSVNYPLNWYNNSIHPCNCHQAVRFQNEFLRIYFS